MEQLLASTSLKPKIFSRGEEVEGEVVGVTASDIIIDLGAKAEGVLGKRDLPAQSRESLKIGEMVKAFVFIPESESGQVILSMVKQTGRGIRGGFEQAKKWQKFFMAKQQNKQMTGKIVEINRGGMVVEVEGVRGFLPSSHLGLGSLKGLNDLNNLAGQEIVVSVIEVDLGSNRLIFSARPKVSQEIQARLNNFQIGQTITGRLAAVMPFGLCLDIDGLEGVVFAQEVSWEDESADLSSLLKTGQEIEAKIIGKDETLGRLNLSIRQLLADPFEETAKDYQVDDVVKGMVTEVTQNGVKVKLDDNIDGFVQPGKIEHGVVYEVGQTTSFLVESIDKNRRRITLAPFLTTTKGLIYK